MNLSNEESTFDELSAQELIQHANEARKSKCHEKALRFFVLAFQKNPSNINLSVEVARSLVDMGDIDSGHRRLISLVHLNQVPIYALLGRIERIKGNRESALRYYSLALDLKPDHPTLPSEVATELRALGRLEEAEDRLLLLLESFPNSPHALNGLGQISRLRGEREIALSYYRALEVADPNHPNVHIDIAIELRELGRLEESSQALACSRSPNQGAIFHQKGLIAIAQEDDQLAIDCFKTGIERQKDHLACHKALIAKFIQLGLLDEAKKVLEIALEIFPSNVAIRQLEYRYMRAKGELDRAISLVHALNQSEPDNLDVVHDFVDYLIFLGQFERVSSVIESSEKNYNKDKLLYLKSKLALAKFQLDDASTLLDKAMSINPENDQYQQQRLLINIMLGNIQGAQDNLRSRKVKFEKKGWGAKKLKSVGGFPAQVLREIKLNPYANKRLGESSQLPFVERICSVAKIVKDEPNHLGAVICLLTLLARNKKCIQNLRLIDGDVKCNIPSNIIQFWDTKDVPSGMEEVMQSWKRLNPNFHYQLFNDQSAQEFIQRYHSPDVLRAFRMANHPAMRSDLFRIAYLLEFGGVYADADDLCNKPLDEFLGKNFDLILIQEPLGSIGNNFIAVKQRHPFIEFALKNIVSNILSKAGGIWFSSGPGALTISFCQMYIEFLEQRIIPQGVALKESYYLHRYVIPHLPMNYKSSVSSWRSPAGQASKIYR